MLIQKQLLLSFAFVLTLLSGAQAQNPDFNLTLVSQVTFDANGNDIWGYVDGNGIEYAVMGLADATVVLSLEDPTNPVEIYRVNGSGTIWRDMKTWGNYIYSVCDNCPDGLVIIDMTDPTNPTNKILTSIPDNVNGGSRNVSEVHNIWIDEFGFLYFSGASFNGGGVVILDVATDGWNPEIVGYGPARYSHDVYVRGNLAYSSDINDGFFSVLDVTDKSNVIELATQETISRFTHNAWLSDDGNVLYTTDEVDFAYIEAHDVSDLNDIRRLDAYRPPSTEELGVTPHNNHVFNDYIITSYYTDGIKIIDAQYPDNLTEVGSFDTYFAGSGGTDGNWGAYPFLPSGVILISDINEGLFVLQPNYVRASYLEGLVTDAVTGIGIPEVQVDILGTMPNFNSTNNFGTYKTGLAQEGMIDVLYSHPLYHDSTITVDFNSDVIEIVDVALRPLFAYVSATGRVVDADGNGIPNENVVLVSPDITYNLSTNANGDFTAQIFDLAYEAQAGSWGYGDTLVSIADVSTSVIEVTLPGTGVYYSDRFIADQGWAVNNMAETGEWELGIPEGTNFQGPLNPDGDSPFDIGDQCYGTGLVGNTPFDNDVDGVFNELKSPQIELTPTVTEIELSFDYWFRSSDVNGDINDTLEANVYIDGNFEGRIVSIADSDTQWRTFNSGNLMEDFNLSPGYGQLEIEFVIGDPEGPGSPVEAAIDNVLIDVTGISSTKTEAAVKAGISVFPNPVDDIINIDASEFDGNLQRALIYDMSGKIMVNVELDNSTTQLDFNYATGLYSILLIDEKGRQYSKRVVKH